MSLPACIVVIYLVAAAAFYFSLDVLHANLTLAAAMMCVAIGLVVGVLSVIRNPQPFR